MPVVDQVVDDKRYTLIPRVLIFLTCGEKVLLLKGAPTKRIWANLYNGIGGHVERGENLLSAARRELLEEAGVVPAALWLTGVVTVNTGQNPGIGIFIFKGESSQEALVPSREGEPEWVSVKDFHQLPLVEDLPALLERVVPARQGDTPFVGNYYYNSEDQLVMQFS
jgi:8-oxo-dGTP diphosphatase